MPSDDVPSDEPGDAASTDTGGRPRRRTADIVATLVLLVVHGFLLGATLLLLGLLVMSTDACASLKCGDAAWIGRAMTLGTWGGATVLLLDFVVALYLLLRRKVAFFVPIIGCIGQLVLAAAAVTMELQAGPA